MKGHAFRPFVKLPVKKAVDMLRPYFVDVVIGDQKIFDRKEKWEKVLNIIPDPSKPNVFTNILMPLFRDQS